MYLASIFRVLAASGVSASIAALLLIMAEAPALAENGLLFKQFSARYGSVTCMATPKNFRMDASELRVFLRPPFKQMEMYNMSSKARLTCPIENIGKEVDWRVLNQDEKKAGAKEVIVEKGTELLQDYKLTHYLINLVFPKKPGKPAKPSKPDKAKLDFWTTRDKDFNFPKNMELACCTLTGLPTGYGFPVRMYSYETKTERSGRSYQAHFKVLDTTKIVKQDFPDTAFEEPKGFRTVNDLMELMVSSEN